MKGKKVMTQVKKQKSLKLSVKDNKLCVNYAQLKLTIKEYKKKLELLQEEVANLFDEKKINILFIQDDKQLGYIQKITRNMKRFDSTQFKSDNPVVYEKYLTDLDTVEYKPMFEVSNEQ